MLSFSHNFFVSLSVCHQDNLPLVDQFFITVVKLHDDMNFQAIAYQTGFGKTTVREYFWKWINVMYANLSFRISKLPVLHFQFLQGQVNSIN